LIIADFPFAPNRASQWHKFRYDGGAMLSDRTFLEARGVFISLGIVAIVAVIFKFVALAAVAVLLILFSMYFFRDPDREIPGEPRAIVAPADGKIVAIREQNGEKMVAIFLSVFDVHVQRAPISGKVTKISYHRGKFLNALTEKAAEVNENQVIELEADDGFRVRVRQIAGLIARRIVKWCEEGDQLDKGARIGMIRYGSRVEIFMPARVEIVAKLGEHATGGETIIAYRA
jgi:phosphatidylserine decarboxylase